MPIPTEHRLAFMKNSTLSPQKNETRLKIINSRCKLKIWWNFLKTKFFVKNIKIKEISNFGKFHRNQKMISIQIPKTFSVRLFIV